MILKSRNVIFAKSRKIPKNQLFSFFFLLSKNIHYSDKEIRILTKSAQNLDYFLEKQIVIVKQFPDCQLMQTWNKPSFPHKNFMKTEKGLTWNVKVFSDNGLLTSVVSVVPIVIK